jgi:hypothetical protein
MDKLLLVALILLLVFGHPGKTIASWLWPNSVAPWENVHAFYYPDRDSLAVDKRRVNIGSLAACRAWVEEQFEVAGDPRMQRGDYECGIGCDEMDGDMFLCRLTVR